MVALLWETALLLLGAYFLGAFLGCMLRRFFFSDTTRARTAETAVAAGGSTAAVTAGKVRSASSREAAVPQDAQVAAAESGTDRFEKALTGESLAQQRADLEREQTAQADAEPIEPVATRIETISPSLSERDLAPPPRVSEVAQADASGDAPPHETAMDGRQQDQTDSGTVAAAGAVAAAAGTAAAAFYSRDDEPSDNSDDTVTQSESRVDMPAQREETPLSPAQLEPVVSRHSDSWTGGTISDDRSDAARSETSAAGLAYGGVSAATLAQGVAAHRPGRMDDLEDIRGIDADIAAALNAKGVHTWSDLAAWSSQDVAAIDQELGLDGRITRQNWVEQASVLAAGGTTAFAARRALGLPAFADPSGDSGRPRVIASATETVQQQAPVDDPNVVAASHAPASPDDRGDDAVVATGDPDRGDDAPAVAADTDRGDDASSVTAAMAATATASALAAVAATSNAATSQDQTREQHAETSSDAQTKADQLPLAAGSDGATSVAARVHSLGETDDTDETAGAAASDAPTAYDPTSYDASTAEAETGPAKPHDVVGASYESDRAPSAENYDANTGANDDASTDNDDRWRWDAAAVLSQRDTDPNNDAGRVEDSADERPADSAEPTRQEAQLATQDDAGLDRAVAQDRTVGREQNVGEPVAESDDDGASGGVMLAAGAAASAAAATLIGGHTPELQPDQSQTTTVSDVEGDDLTRIDGINPEVARLLTSRGTRRYTQIADWSAEDVARFDHLLGSSGRVARENWVGQARELAGLDRADDAPSSGGVASDRGGPETSAGVAGAAALAAASAAATSSAAESSTSGDEAASTAAAWDAELGSSDREPLPEPGTSSSSLAGLRSVKSQALVGDDGRAAPAQKDDLKRIRGLGVRDETRLNAIGIASYDQIADWTARDIDEIGTQLGVKGRIAKENWIEQARLLASGATTKFAARQDRDRPYLSDPDRSNDNVATTPDGHEQASREHHDHDQAFPVERSSEEPLQAGNQAQAEDGTQAAKLQAVEADTRILSAKPTDEPDVERWGRDENAGSQSTGPDFSQIREITPDTHTAQQTAQQTGEQPDADESAFGVSSSGTTAVATASVAAVAAGAVASTVRAETTDQTVEQSAATAVDATDPAPVVQSGQLSRSKIGATAQADDLKRIRGIGILIEKKLHGLGITTYQQVANWTRDDVERVNRALTFQGRIERENWIEQARILSSGGTTEFSRRVDRGEV